MVGPGSSAILAVWQVLMTAICGSDASDLASSDVVTVTLRVLTLQTEGSETRAGATFAFRVGSAWLPDEELCAEANAGEVVAVTRQLQAWPSQLRLRAKRHLPPMPDAWGLQELSLLHKRTGNSIVVLEACIAEQCLYSSGSPHWIYSHQEYTTYSVPALMCRVPSKVIHAGSAPCLEGSTDIVQGGVCTAFCLAPYQPSVQTLACVNGSLSPPTFECTENAGSDRSAATSTAGSNVASAPNIWAGPLCEHRVGVTFSGVICKGATAGFVMYSAQVVRLRFSQDPVHPANADHFVCVRHGRGGWEYSAASDWHPYSLQISDVLVASVDLLTGALVKLNGTSSAFHGVTAGYAHGDLELELTALPPQGTKSFHISGVSFFSACVQVESSAGSTGVQAAAPTGNVRGTQQREQQGAWNGGARGDETVCLLGLNCDVLWWMLTGLGAILFMLLLFCLYRKCCGRGLGISKSHKAAPATVAVSAECTDSRKLTGIPGLSEASVESQASADYAHSSRKALEATNSKHPLQDDGCNDEAEVQETGEIKHANQAMSRFNGSRTLHDNGVSEHQPQNHTTRTLKDLRLRPLAYHDNPKNNKHHNSEGCIRRGHEDQRGAQRRHRKIEDKVADQTQGSWCYGAEGAIFSVGRSGDEGLDVSTGLLLRYDEQLKDGESLSGFLRPNGDWLQCTNLLKSKRDGKTEPGGGVRLCFVEKLCNLVVNYRSPNTQMWSVDILAERMDVADAQTTEVDSVSEVNLESISVSEVPQQLCVLSPHVHVSCAGMYSIVPEVRPGGAPLWKKKDSERWLYLGVDGNWYIGGRTSYDKGFKCASGFIYCREGRSEALPHHLRSWEWGDGKQWCQEDTIRVIEVAQSCWETDGLEQPQQSQGAALMPQRLSCDSPGKYIISHHNTAVTADAAVSTPTYVAHLARGTVVDVVEVTILTEGQRVRGRLAEPAGWISLAHMADGYRWAEKQPEGGHCGGQFQSRASTHEGSSYGGSVTTSSTNSEAIGTGRIASLPYNSSEAAHATLLPWAPPRLLRISCPNGRVECAGLYALVAGEKRNSQPIWEQSSNGGHWLYSALSGKWCVGGDDVYAKGFATSAGYLYQTQAHEGRMPHESKSPWRRWDGVVFQEDRDISVKAATPSLLSPYGNSRSNSSAPSRSSSFSSGGVSATPPPTLPHPPPQPQSHQSVFRNGENGTIRLTM